MFTESLPSDLDVEVTINVAAAAGGLYSNGLIIFDYQHSSNFKFAGAYAGGGKWVVGHRSGSNWLTDAQVFDAISAGVDYPLQLSLKNNGLVSLSVGGVPKVKPCVRS